MNSELIKRAKNLSRQVQSFGTDKPKAQVRAYLTEVAPPTDKLEAIIEPLVKHHVGKLQPPELEITSEMVKKIISIMHTLPENDKLEVSKGIRNAQSFMFNKTKYGMHEMMHGGAAASTAATQVYGEVVAGSGTTWTLVNPPDSGTLRLYANGQRLTVTVDYTQTTIHITTTNSFSAGTLLADYAHS